MGNKTLTFPFLQCLILAGFGVAYTFLLPPFEAPDETGHLARAHALAEGQFLLVDHPRYFFWWGAKLQEGQNPNSVAEMELTLAEVETERVPMFAGNTAVYSPLPYLFHAGLFKLTGVKGDISFTRFRFSYYLGRLLTLTLFIAAFYFSARHLPNLRWPLFWLAATPFVLAQASVIHVDSILYGATMVLLAVAFVPMGLRPFVGLVGLSIFVTLLTKPSYAPLLLIPMIGLWSRKAHKKEWGWLGGFIALGVVGAAFWNQAALEIYNAPGGLKEFMSGLVAGEVVDPGQQLTAVLQSPLWFAEVLWDTFTHSGEVYRQFVAVLGRLSISLPHWVTPAWALLAVVAILGGHAPDDANRRRRLLVGVGLVSTAVLTLVAISLSTYMAWTPVAWPIIHLQGRYFHVVGLVLAMGLAWLNPVRFTAVWQNRLAWVLVATAVGLNGVALITIWQQFYS